MLKRDAISVKKDKIG